MAKKANPAPSRTCADCFHFCACHLWAVSISTDVAPKCTQFEPARYASLADLHEMYKMAKGELVPVVHGRWEWYEDWGPSTWLDPPDLDKSGWKCSNCGIDLGDYLTDCLGVNVYVDEEDKMPKINSCPNCGAKMDGGAEG